MIDAWQRSTDFHSYTYCAPSIEALHCSAELLYKLNTHFDRGVCSCSTAHSMESRGDNISWGCLFQELLLTRCHQQQDCVFCSLQTPSIPIDLKVKSMYISVSDKALGSSQQHEPRVEMLRYQISQTWLWSRDLPRVASGAGHPR